MTTKKKVIAKPKKELIEVHKTLPPYKPVFPPLEFKFTKKIDLNYYGIKQWLKNKIGLDLFRKLKKENGENKKENKISLWIQYSNWWNNLFNKGGIK